MDLFGTTGQQRRAWLDGIDQRIGEGLRYFLGPSGVDRRANALAAVAPMAMDGTDYIDATEASRNLFADPTFANALAFATPMVALAMPGVSARMAEGAADFGGDLARFVGDESGALRLFHGSPHDFDKFSMDKIGTGEGAQAYGHGLYFAESEGVARAYRDALARPYYAMSDGVDVAQKYGADVVDAFESVGGDPTEIAGTIQRLRRMVARDLQEFGVSSVSDLRPQYDGDLASSVINAARRADGLEALLKSDGVKRVNEGRLYEVNVNANPADFLDWDAPLSAQPQKVRDAIDKVAPVKVFHSRLGNEYRAYLEGPGGIVSSFSGATREEAMEKALRGLTGENIVRSNVPTMLSRDLSEAGIPGIRYLDAGSRGAGDGSRNYVVFDENLITIIRKYGIAGAAAMLGVSQADLEAMMAGQEPAQANALSGL